MQFDHRDARGWAEFFYEKGGTRAFHMHGVAPHIV